MISKSRKKQLKKHQFIKLVAFLGLLTSIFVVLISAENMLLTTVVAFVLSYILGPAINSLERTGIPRIQSIVIVFALLTLLFTFAVMSISPFVGAQIISLKSELPKYMEGTIKLVQDFEVKVADYTGGLAKINFAETAQSLLSSWSTAAFEGIPTLVSKSLSTLIMAPFFAFFLLKDGQKLSRKLLGLVPNNIFELTLNLINQINDQMAQFVRARLLEALFVGTVVWLGLSIIGFPYATILSIFAAIMNLIPYVGPFIGAVPAIIIAFINGNTPIEMTLMISVYAFAQIIDIFFIIPLVVAKIVDLHPITVIIVLLLGFQIMGVLGMLISIPVASAIKLTISTVYNHLIELSG